MTTPSTKSTERAEALATLREILPPGSTVYCVLRSVSRSGMSRRIDFYRIEDNQPRYLSGLIAKVLDMRHPADSRQQGLRVDGCGMDMGFHIVYTVARVLYRDGWNDAVSGLPSTRDAGYALRSEWI